MNKISRFHISVILFLTASGLLHAASFYSPIPSPVSVQADINISLDLFIEDNIEMNFIFGPEVGFSMFPISDVPIISAASGIYLSFFLLEPDSGVFMRAGTAISLHLAPFMYNDSLHSFDILGEIDAELSSGYRLKISEELFIEPNAGGRLSLFTSLFKYSGGFFFPGIFAELNVILKI